MKEVRSQKCFQLRDICKSEVCASIVISMIKASMHIETVLTINSQEIHSDFHTSVYRLATLPLKQTYANAAIYLHVNLISTKSAKTSWIKRTFIGCNGA